MKTDMDRSDVIYLIKETYHMDDHNQPIPEKTKRHVYCNAKSITRTELFDAGQNGHRASWMFEMFFYDYDDEKLVEYNGKRYGVYRTYRPSDDTMELYVEEKGGIR